MIFTLFVDMILELVDYFLIRGIFAPIGSLVNVFIQRQRNIGRVSQFVFVWYSSLELHLRLLAF